MPYLVLDEEGADGKGSPGPLDEHAGGSVPQRLVREELGSLRALLALSMVMAHHPEEGIVRLALGAVSQLSECRPLAGYLPQGRRLVGWCPGGDLTSGAGHAVPVEARCDIEAQVEALAGGDGPICWPETPWAWAYPLSGREVVCGYLIVGAQTAPPEHQRFVLRALAQQAGAALLGAKLSREQGKLADALRAVTADLKLANEKLITSSKQWVTAEAQRATSEQLVLQR